MAESAGPPPGPGESLAETPEAFLREGGREAEAALRELEEAVVRDRQAVGALAEELARSARDLHYERKWRGRDHLLGLANSLATRGREAVEACSALLEQVIACEKLRGRQAELIEALSLLEAELAPFASAVSAADSALDPTTPYGAFIPTLRLFAAEMEAVGRELEARPLPEDFVESSLRKKYRAALGRLAAGARGVATPDYAALHGRVSAAREKLMQGVLLAKARTDRDAEALRGVERLRGDLASEFERVEILFAELEAGKGGAPRPPPQQPAPGPAPERAPVPEEARRRGLLGRLRK